MAGTAVHSRSSDPSLESLRRAGLRQLVSLVALIGASSALCALTPASPRDVAQGGTYPEAQAVLAPDATLRR